MTDHDDPSQKKESSATLSADPASAPKAEDSSVFIQMPPAPKPKDPTKVTFDDIKGLTKAKEIVKDTLINPVLFPEICRQMGLTPGKGMLLYGPPGTGKTMFAQAIANELHSEFRLISLDDIRGKTPLETTSKIKDVFAAARMTTNGCVLFIDDCEEILSRPGKSKAYGVGQFLTELDGIKPQADGKGNVFVMIATNRPWMIDGALLRAGRISEAVYVGLPEKEARQEILNDAFADTVLASDVDLEKLAEMTDGYCCAELHHRVNGGGICDLARRYAAKRWMERVKKDPDERFRVEPIFWNDLMEAMHNVTPASVRDRERIRQNEEFRIKMEGLRPDIAEEDEAEDLDPQDDTSSREGSAIHVDLPDIQKLKNAVFSSRTIQETPDYKHFADQVYFYCNTEHEDSKTFNAMATTVADLKQRYGLTDTGDDPARPAIIIYEGLNLANTAVAAAYLKFFGDLRLTEPQKLRDFLFSMNRILCANNGRFGLQQMKELDQEYDIFSTDEVYTKNVETLASAMDAFVIAHELGHIVTGDIFKSPDGLGAYSRNMERAADQFAATLFDGLEDPKLRELFYLGAALSFIADISLGTASQKIDVESGSSHPATQERFSNLIKNAQDALEKFNLNDEIFAQCII